MTWPHFARRATAGLLLGLMVSLTACTSGSTAPGIATSGDGSSSSSSGAQSAEGDQEPAYDVTPLIHPDKKYLGVAVNGAPSSLNPVNNFADLVGKQPNIIASYSAWGDGFNVEGAKNALKSGALLYVSWEPFTPSVAKIADGSQDDYIKSYAAAVREANAPVALSFGHEMNGHWYAWGTKKTKPADFVKAWRHIHDLFQEEGTTNVIWTWSPNVVNPVPTVKLKPLWPGDAYVDWVGVVGYWTLTGASTFDTLYGPTVKQIRRFTDKPLIITETSSEPGERRRADVRNLFKGVEDDPDLLGFIWFNITKRADWRIQASPLALAEFKRLATAGDFGFDVRKQ
ncbi:glycoside hydrolase family 26 protein [Streptomyces sp. NBC_01262]|uniref:glycoside hydrolase family 26 protein n=1 Tax=Streptomyces sp. NBC_01262 TaxID=2903803 RepID=UPI002E36AD6B|nr:glycosyl hydrolase [Streptomyces sp. NBC_01262]